MAHGIQADMVPKKFGGKQGLIIDETFVPLNFDGEKLFFNISRPTEKEIEALERFELTSPKPVDVIGRARKKKIMSEVPLLE